MGPCFRTEIAVGRLFFCWIIPPPLSVTLSGLVNDLFSTIVHPFSSIIQPTGRTNGTISSLDDLVSSVNDPVTRSMTSYSNVQYTRRRWHSDLNPAPARRPTYAECELVCGRYPRLGYLVFVCGVPIPPSAAVICRTGRWVAGGNRSLVRCAQTQKSHFTQRSIAADERRRSLAPIRCRGSRFMTISEALSSA